MTAQKAFTIVLEPSGQCKSVDLSLLFQSGLDILTRKLSPSTNASHMIMLVVMIYSIFHIFRKTTFRLKNVIRRNAMFDKLLLSDQFVSDTLFKSTDIWSFMLDYVLNFLTSHRFRDLGIKMHVCTSFHIVIWVQIVLERASHTGNRGKANMAKINMSGRY